MINYKIDHHIQKYILSILYRQKVARFRDLRERGVDTNLFAYHLKRLLKNDFVKKVTNGYTLGDEGLRYVDRASEATMKIRIQPKIITMLVMQNSDGEILLQKRKKQPYIDLWTLPYGKTHIEDNSIAIAALREAQEKVNIKSINPIHVGDCYIRVFSNNKVITVTFAHIFKCTNDGTKQNDAQVWVSPRCLHEYNLAPAVEKIIARTFFNDAFFFEEFTEKVN